MGERAGWFYSWFALTRKVKDESVEREKMEVKWVKWGQKSFSKNSSQEKENRRTALDITTLLEFAKTASRSLFLLKKEDETKTHPKACFSSPSCHNVSQWNKNRQDRGKRKRKKERERKISSSCLSHRVLLFTVHYFTVQCFTAVCLCVCVCFTWDIKQSREWKKEKSR